MQERFCDEKEVERRRIKNEKPAIFWLAKTIKANDGEIEEALKLVRDGPHPYRIIHVRKRNGGKRELAIPSPTLKKIQRKINKRILCDFPVAKNVYGFSGGSIIDAIKPHLGLKSILCVDIKNAFPSVSSLMVFGLLTKGRKVVYFDHIASQTQYLWYGPYHRAVSEFTPGYMSWYAARIVTQLTTFKNQLPQGAPTSPKLFDIFCKQLDERLLEFAKKVRGTYTRYADNIFFSMPNETFPKSIKNAVSHKMRKEGFVPHKFKTGKLNKECLRILGLNLINNEIHNTRNFKRALRLSIHHMNWLLDNEKNDTPEFEKAWQKLRGQINFATTDTMPQKLLNDYLELKKRLR